LRQAAQDHVGEAEGEKLNQQCHQAPDQQVERPERVSKASAHRYGEAYDDTAEGQGRRGIALLHKLQFFVRCHQHVKRERADKQPERDAELQDKIRKPRDKGVDRRGKIHDAIPQAATRSVSRAITALAVPAQARKAARGKRPAIGAMRSGDDR